VGRLQSEGPLVVETDYEACAKDGTRSASSAASVTWEFERQGILPAVPIAAPVLMGERYHDRPLYFSDVIVDRDSRFRSFLDLRGRSSAIRIR